MSIPAAAIRTIEASERLPFGAPVRACHLDQPTPGRIEGNLTVAGWALAETGPVDRVAAIAAGKRLAHVRPDRRRPDLAAAFPDVGHAETTGFRMLLPSILLEGIDELVIAVEVDRSEAIPIWTVRFAASEPEPRGRLGSRPPAHPVIVDKEAGGSPAGSEITTAVNADSLQVVAIISTFNEADIIGPVLEHLGSNGISSYLIDTDSTDDTLARAEEWLGKGLLGIESLPPADSGRVSWKRILARKLELSRELGADWYLHHDADEIRESPWPGVSLHEAIRVVDRLGYNAIDFRVLNFPPVDDAFRPGHDPREHFTRWEDPAEYDRLQRKGWKAGVPDVSLEDGGHEVRFADRRLFPLRFVLRHYPIRSQAHGVRKVLQERKERFTADELAVGWHRQYRHVHGVDHVFLKNPALLHPFDLDRIRVDTVLEDGRAAATESDEAAGGESARGVLDQANPTTISGWAAREDGDGEPLIVELWDGGRPIANVEADRPREDLEKLGIAGGRAGFTIQTPPELLDGRPHWIWATVRGSGVALRQSPLVLSTGNRPTAPGEGDPAEPPASA